MRYPTRYQTPASRWDWLTSPWFRVALAALALVVFACKGNHAAGAGVAMLALTTDGGTATIDGLLREFYDDEFIAEGVNNKNPLKDVIEDKLMEKTYGGRHVVYPFHTARNRSPFASAEYGLFAEADVQTVIQVVVEARKMMARTILTPEAIADSARSEMAFEDAEELNFTKMIDDLARRDELFTSYSGRGTLALINTATPNASSTMAVDAPAGITGSVFGNRFFQSGTYVGAINPATGGLRATIRKVLSLSSDGNSIAMDDVGGATWAENDILVKAANANVTDAINTEYENWWWGMLGIFDDGTYRADYGGIDRTVIDNANTYVNPSTGTLSIDTLQMLADAMDTRCGGITSLMLCHNSVRRLVIKLTQPDRRYMGESLSKPDPGTVAFKQGDITIGEVPIKAIRDFAFGTLLGIDVEGSKLRRYVSTKGEWVRWKDGDIAKPVGIGADARDAFEAWYRMRYQNWAKEPAYAWRADGITGATIPIVRPLGDQ
jgi:hypothetical protein